MSNKHNCVRNDVYLFILIIYTQSDVRQFATACTVHRNKLYKQTNKMHFLYVFILQHFCNSTCLKQLFLSSPGFRKFTVSAALYKPCRRVQLLGLTNR